MEIFKARLQLGEGDVGFEGEGFGPGSVAESVAGEADGGGGDDRGRVLQERITVDHRQFRQVFRQRFGSIVRRHPLVEAPKEHAGSRRGHLEIQHLRREGKNGE